MGIGVFTACRSLYGITEYPEQLYYHSHHSPYCTRYFAPKTTETLLAFARLVCGVEAAEVWTGLSYLSAWRTWPTSSSLQRPFVGVHARVKWSTSSKQNFYPCNPMRKKGEAVPNRIRASLVYRETEQP